MKNVTTSRRNFLKIGAAAAGIAGVAAAGKALPNTAKAVQNANYTAPTGRWSVLRETADYGGASVSFVEHNDKWLGTTQIFGPIKRSRESEQGFGFARPILKEQGLANTMGIDPMGSAFSKTKKIITPDAVCEGEPNETKLPLPDPEALSMHIKDYCYFMRADEVGIGKVPEYSYYSHISIDGMEGEQENPWIQKALPYAVVVAIDQGIEGFWASSGYGSISMSQSQMAYYQSGVIAVALADYIRRMGYEARAVHSANYLGLMPVLLIAAGMGELTRVGDAVMHPRLGFRTKVAGVLTDLPLAPDKPIDFGGIDFCRVCKKCADNCPSQSISFDRDPIEHNGYLRWNSNGTTCAVFRLSNANGSSCGTCIKVCPWSSKEDSWFHKAGIWIGSKGETASSLLKGIDDIFGYGEEVLPQYKWWIEWPELWPSKTLAP